MDTKHRLVWYEDNCQEIKNNPDGSVTFVFDEPSDRGSVGEAKPTSSITISKKDYEKAQADPNLLV